jgi:FMN reductase
MTTPTPAARTLLTVSAGLGSPSASRLLAERLGAAASTALADRGVTASTRLVELREHAHDLTNAVVTGVPTGELPGILADTARADGLIVVTPIFNASYNALFKAYFDALEPDTLTGKPVLIAATGGTPRHSLALDHVIRPLLTYLRAVVAPTGVYAATEDWGAGEGLTARITRAGGELADLVARRSAAPTDPYSDPIPFDRLLAG